MVDLNRDQPTTSSEIGLPKSTVHLA